MMSIPRKEHPKPQFERTQWLNLNGEWKFAFDFGLSGEAQGWAQDPSSFTQTIIVPFCPESELSGLGYKDFIPSVWYHKELTIPQSWDGRRVLLHFGAVDYQCKVWVNGELVGEHLGGSASFSFDITDFLAAENNQLVVNAMDDVRSGQQPVGKQSQQFHSYACRYTRVTGIWQTVWLEAVPETYLKGVRITPDLDNSCFYIEPRYSEDRRGMEVQAVLRDGDQIVASDQIAASAAASIKLELTEPKVWDIDNPFLYKLELTLRANGVVVDQVKSYCGLRKFHVEGHRCFLNNRPIFLRLILDQGFYPDGIWTAPSDDALRQDIELSQAVGFHGARLHQKVFEERFLYWADRLGYITWGEFCDWGMDFGQIEASYNHLQEWRQVVERDYNHPSIIAWTPFNETSDGAKAYPEIHARVIRDAYNLTKSLDPTRPIIDASGYVHVFTDIYTVHDYDQNPETFFERYQRVDPNDPSKAWANFENLTAPYAGQPYLVDEYGGTYWTAEHEGQEPRGERRIEWGYGKTASQVEDVVDRLTKVLTDNPNVSGFTYCQLTDVEQEVNGIYTYDRKPKFDLERLRAVFTRPAAIEK